MGGHAGHVRRGIIAGVLEVQKELVPPVRQPSQAGDEAAQLTGQDHVSDTRPDGCVQAVVLREFVGSPPITLP